MSVQLTEEIKQAIYDKDSIKVVATISKEGVPHVTAKGSLTVDEEGRIKFLELLEKSQTQRNLVYSIWFDKKVAINIITADKRSYQIKGVPYKAITTGHVFQEAYIDVQNRLGKDIDLSAIWLIDVEEAYEETFAVKREQLETEFPYELHVDRLAKEEYR